ncbi:hypothetical protein HY389_01810 [Candidatus Daviesbacteria bacterium]|nr:hypothetical protein [Candidatus Daviesbacteria bacterium]
MGDAVDVEIGESPKSPTEASDKVARTLGGVFSGLGEYVSGGTSPATMKLNKILLDTVASAGAGAVIFSEFGNSDTNWLKIAAGASILFTSALRRFPPAS